MSANVVPKAPHLAHFGYPNRKKAVQTNFKKSMKNRLPKNPDFLWKWTSFVWSSGSLFQGFSDPDPTRSLKPQNVRKRSPKAHQNVTKMTSLRSDLFLELNLPLYTKSWIETCTGEYKGSKFPLETLEKSKKTNPARRNARSALNMTNSVSRLYYVSRLYHAGIQCSFQS